ncbi:MAG TPA: hypothetical protein VF519_00115 [Mycobacteriales bacterium]|jgi:phage baseplate assembly protein W
MLGTDLTVLPWLSAHDASEADLVTRPRTAQRVDPNGAVAPVTEVTDLGTWSERQNLAQALILRLLTPVGSLAALGHAAYGSRLHELIGQPRDDARRNLCRAYVLEAVAQEPRVDPKAVALDFDREAESVDSFVFVLQVRPLDGGDPLAVSLEVAL